MVLIGTACNKNSANPETAYQACLAAEKAYNELAERYEQTEKEGKMTPVLKDSLDKEVEYLFEEAKKEFTAFFEKNINTPFAQQIFSKTRWTRRLNMDQLDLVINQVTDPAFKETDAFKNATERVFAMKNAQPGHPYINIISKNPEGNAAELSEYVGKGKYVLLDFWASWCPDCRKEMPALVDLYNTFKDKNFEIVGYSLDKKEDAWKNGIAELNMAWPQLSDCDFWNSQGAKLYAVQFIPLSLLIDPEGKIIERGLSIDELHSKIEDLTK